MVKQVMQSERATPSLQDRAWLVASALVPALIAGSELGLFADGGRDARMIRAVGLGYTGGFRALDAWVAALCAGLPLGTRTLRAELSGVLLLAVAAALMFAVVRRILVAMAGPSAWSSIVAAIATATASLSYPLQHEAASAGSSLTGVVLVLVTLALAARASPSWIQLVAVSALALSYNLRAGSCAVVAVVVAALFRLTETGALAMRRGPLSPSALLAGALAVTGGLAPFGLAAVGAHATSRSTSARLFASPEGNLPVASGGGVRHAFALVQGELGEVLLLLAVIGVVLGLASRRARPVVVQLAAVTVAACTMLAVDRSATREAWSLAGLVALAGLVGLAAIAMQEGVLWVARARLPLASASAAMVVVLEAAFPAIMADDGVTRACARPGRALATWEDTAFTGLPGGTVLFVSAPGLYPRLLATEASGNLPGDLTLIPTFDPSNEAAAAALSRDPRMVPLFRDLALTGSPQELSLSTLASTLPVALAPDPRWDRGLTRHMLPAGLFSVFEPEPRGGTDRKRALEASADARARLAKELGSAPVAPLAALTASILFDRALVAAETGEREVALRALDDASVFAPNDPRIARLTSRERSARGTVDVHDLLRDGLAGATP